MEFAANSSGGPFSLHALERAGWRVDVDRCETHYFALAVEQPPDGGARIAVWAHTRAAVTLLVGEHVTRSAINPDAN